MSITKFNHVGRKFTFNTPTNHPYKSLEDVFTENGSTTEQVYTVRALYINHKSKFGDAPCLVTDFETINLPKHMTEDVKSIIADDDIVADINNGNVGFTIAPYEKDGRIFYSINWVEI